MRNKGPNGKFLVVFVMVLLPLSSPRSAMAADKPPDTSTSGSPSLPRWLLHIDATGVFPHPGANVSILGTRVPGGSLSINNSATVTGDVSYFLTPSIAVNLYAGVPARGVIKGAGSLSALGTLATSLYGVAILSAEYHATNFGAFKPYAGIGPAYSIFLDTRDGALGNVKVPNAWGVAFSIGADYDINDRWTFNVYLKQILLSTTVTATLRASRPHPRPRSTQPFSVRELGAVSELAAQHAANRPTPAICRSHAHCGDGNPRADSLRHSDGYGGDIMLVFVKRGPSTRNKGGRAANRRFYAACGGQGANQVAPRSQAGFEPTAPGLGIL